MQGHKAGMNAHTDGRQVEVVEQYGQMIMQSASRMKVQLQIACGCQRQLAATILFAEPELQLQWELSSFDGLLQVTAVNCREKKTEWKIESVGLLNIVVCSTQTNPQRK